VTLAVRPEAWRVEPAAEMGPTLAGRLSKRAYLGSFLELTFETELGDIFVVCGDVDRTWQVGDTLGLALAGQGVSVVGR
jgi:iron(III) transport system ATP-binding protein